MHVGGLVKAQPDDSLVNADTDADMNTKSKANAYADTGDCSSCCHSETMHHSLCKQKVHLDRVIDSRSQLCFIAMSDCQKVKLSGPPVMDATTQFCFAAVFGCQKWKPQKSLQHNRSVPE